MCEQEIPQLDIDYASYTSLTLSIYENYTPVQKKRFRQYMRSVCIKFSASKYLLIRLSGYMLAQCSLFCYTLQKILHIRPTCLGEILKHKLFRRRPIFVLCNSRAYSLLAMILFLLHITKNVTYVRH